MSDCQHHCECQARIPCRDGGGLAIRTASPPVKRALRREFDAACEQGDVFLASGDRFVERLRAIFSALSEAERAATRATFVEPDGTIDPWAAAPIDRVLERLETPWLPALLNGDHLRFDLQPIVEARTLRPFAHEALVRGAGPHAGRRPDEMLRAAKAHDALLKFDQAARRLAIERCCPKLEGEERLFVNFLPITIYDPEVCLRSTFAAAERAGADFSRIVFEVVESEEFPDIEHLRRILDAYRARGARVALDDLGAGNTALTFIHRLEPDFVKLDRDLVREVAAHNEVDMIGGIVRHADARGITTIAEGIETYEELEFVRSIGVDLVQGWLIARPSAEPVRTHNVRRSVAA